jgi:hypothetical protein
MKKFTGLFFVLATTLGTLAFGWLALTAQRPLSQIGGVVGLLFGIVLLCRVTGEPKASTWEQIDKSSRDGGYW